MMCAPSLAKPRAIARPIPREAPVIAHTFPSRRRGRMGGGWGSDSTGGVGGDSGAAGLYISILPS